MIKRHQIFTCILLGFLLCALGCTKRYTFNIDPEIFVKTSELGQGKGLTIQVIDTRPQRAIAKRKNDIRDFEIYPTSNLAATVREKVKDGFRRMGFRPLAKNKTSDRVVLVNITQLIMEYKTGDLGIKVSKVQIKLSASLKVSVQTNAGKYKNTYKTIQRRSFRMLTGQSKNEKLVNKGLSVVLHKMFEDPELLHFLTSS